MRSSPAAGPPDRSALDPWTTAAATAAVAVSVVVTIMASSAGAGGVRAYPVGDDGAAATSVAAESHPVGRVSRSTVYQPFARAGFTLDVPSTWQRTERAGYAGFADRLDVVTVEWDAAKGPLTVNGATTREIPALATQARTFTLQAVAQVRRPAGTAVEMVYLQGGAPDLVTGKAVIHAVDRYVFFHDGTRVTVTLAGPEGADNSAAWLRITDSLRWVH